jgi:hypothetical protein
MSRHPVRGLVVAAAVLAAALVCGCGVGQEVDVKEGEPLVLGPLRYNIQITRFLNPGDTEDKGYLVGQPPPTRNTQYLGVFVLIQNDTNDAAKSAPTMTVRDTRGTEYHPIPTKSVYALHLGASVPSQSQLPLPDSTPAEGVIEGSLVLFRVNTKSIENRPLTLIVPGVGGGESGKVQLDI